MLFSSLTKHRPYSASSASSAEALAIVAEVTQRAVALHALALQTQQAEEVKALRMQNANIVDFLIELTLYQPGQQVSPRKKLYKELSRQEERQGQSKSRMEWVSDWLIG